MKYILLVVFLMLPAQAFAEEINIPKMVNAIYLAEGGSKSAYPFGIKSVKCSGFSDCQRVCRNTVRNNVRRWKRADMDEDFISFLGKRYAPRSDSPLNVNWVRNVEYFYNK